MGQSLPWSGKAVTLARLAEVCSSHAILKYILNIGLGILGATNPLASSPGTIRGDYAIDVGRNVCHGSDGVESAKKEIALWFTKDEVISWENAQFEWIYEKP